MTTRTEYAGLFVHECKPGVFTVSSLPEGGINIMPGATWFRTREAALQAIDIYRVVDGDGQKFWHLLRAIQRQHGQKPDLAADLGPDTHEVR